jgi:hypothetical protein
MLEFAMPNESPQIASELGTDSFTLRNVTTGVTTTHQIARGTYNMYELAKQFSISTGGALLCSYLPNQNRLQWTLPAGSQARVLRMPLGLAYICGLLEDTDYVVNAGSFTVGFYACRPVATANLFIRWADWSPEQGGLVLSNMSDDGGLRLDGTLAIVNVSNTPPWHWVSWRNDTPESGGLFSGDTKLSVLELIVTDEESRQADVERRGLQGAVCRAVGGVERRPEGARPPPNVARRSDASRVRKRPALFVEIGADPRRIVVFVGKSGIELVGRAGRVQAGAHECIFFSGHIIFFIEQR